MLNSNYKELCQINLPYAGRQKYMHTFDLSNPVMAQGYEDYLESVKALCAAAGAFKGVAHMTVDEKIIAPGMSQRRPKPHVDGCFMPELNSWGHGGWSNGRGVFRRMPVIVASNEIGCKAWRGKFEGEPKVDGDLSHLDLGVGEILPINIGYLLSPDCIHESLIQTKPVKRTFLRIALPTDFDPGYPPVGEKK